MSVKQADWRRWAILGVLAWPHQGPLTTNALLGEIDRKGWQGTVPTHGRYDALHRSLVTLEKSGYVKRSGRPARWSATENGHLLAREFIHGNPNITPERLEAEALA